MSEEDIAKVAEGVQLLPMTAGEIVLAYNLPGNPKGLKLPRDVYSNIFLGKITQWNDPQIAAANPGLKLPICRSPWSYVPTPAVPRGLHQAPVGHQR
jgi:phosphate transport system substrate-binding protein